MADHVLERLFVSGDGLFGQLTSAGGLTFATMERRWADNLPGVSCVPAGRYQLVRWASKKLPGSDHVYALVGGSVGLKLGPGVTRTLVEIHPANEPLQLEGCIALGTLATSPRRRGLPGVSILASSRPAVRMFFRELDAARGEIWLTIEGGDDGRSGGARSD